MAAMRAMRASRQSAVLAAVAGLHAGAAILFASGMMPRLLEALPAPPDIVVVQRIPEPIDRVQPRLPLPGAYAPPRAPLPDIDIPRVDDAVPSVDATPVTDATVAGAAARGNEADIQPPALQMRDGRLAALIDACYPSAARRMGDEGRAVALVVVNADGRVASWTRMQGSGFPRLDAALDCVIRRLQFLPGRRDGRAIVAEVELPIVFQLQ